MICLFSSVVLAFATSHVTGCVRSSKRQYNTQSNYLHERSDYLGRESVGRETVNGFQLSASWAWGSCQLFVLLHWTFNCWCYVALIGFIHSASMGDRSKETAAPAETKWRCNVSNAKPQKKSKSEDLLVQCNQTGTNTDRDVDSVVKGVPLVPCLPAVWPQLSTSTAFNKHL